MAGGWSRWDDMSSIRRSLGDTAPRQALVLVQWGDREGFDAFLADPELVDLHPLRENGTRRYVWWMFDRLDDLLPLLRR